MHKKTTSTFPLREKRASTKRIQNKPPATGNIHVEEGKGAGRTRMNLKFIRDVTLQNKIRLYLTEDRKTDKHIFLFIATVLPVFRKVCLISGNLR